jgi:carboxyl-terminal processing protease
MPPLENEGFKLEISGSFGGIGVEIGMRNDFLTVIAPLKGSPAEQAGLRSGDIIVAIDDHQTQSMSIDESVHFIRGEVGTQVALTVAREGEQEFRTITVTRDTVNVPTIDTTWNNDVFIVALYNFGGTAVSEMRRALREFVAADGTHLVIDLRGNTGGYLEAAVDIASWFLPAGTEVVREDWGRGKDPVVRRAAGKDVSDGRWRIAVLVDGGTASAAEILAAALRERRGAVLIGEQTFGKGSVQELVEITPETSLKVTIARWLTPNGTSLSENGLTPDTVIPRTMEDVEAGRDPQLDAALRYVRTGVLEKSVSTSTVVQMEEKR